MSDCFNLIIIGFLGRSRRCWTGNMKVTVAHTMSEVPGVQDGRWWDLADRCSAVQDTLVSNKHTRLMAEVVLMRYGCGVVRVCSWDTRRYISLHNKVTCSLSRCCWNTTHLPTFSTTWVGVHIHRASQAVLLVKY